MSLDAPNHTATTPDNANIQLWSKQLGDKIGGLRGVVTTHRWRIVPFMHVLDALPSTQPSEILDIGGGEGLLLFLAERAGKLKSGVSIDASQRNIASGKSALGALGVSSIDLIATEAISNWPDGGFDVVCLIDVMHHIPLAMHAEFFRAACMRVRPGGLLVYKDMASSPAWFAAANRLHDLVLAQQWIHYAPIEQISEWALQSGLTLINQEDVDIFWYRHELRVFEKTRSG